ncbi:MAG: alanine--glyoxylate aminotransferase family protein [bacterium]
MIIFSPGPANISERVRKSLTLPDICHRDSEASQILSDIRQLLLQVGKAKNGYKSVVLTGSGTLAIDSVIASLTDNIKNLLIISNGVYGERARNIAITYKVNFQEINFGWGNLPDLTVIEERLKTTNVDAIYIVHHETSTGLLNPLKEISCLAQKYETLLLVDAISSIGGEEIDLNQLTIDVLMGSGHKCIRGVPGAAFVIVSERFIEKIKKGGKKASYNDLLTHLESEENLEETPFTPAVQVFYAFKTALLELLEEGVENRIAHYKHIAELLRKGLKEIGLKFFLNESLFSNTMTSVYLPAGFSFEKLHHLLKLKGFVIYNSQGHLKGKVFRIGTVGLISTDDIKNFIEELRKICCHPAEV